MPAGLLGIEDLDRAEIEAILARAKDFQPMQSQSLKKLDTLRGKMIVNLFFEASTRTRTSFEIAAKRLGADAVSITASGSSVSKGESLVDTLNTLAAMRPDAIVMRHAACGAPHFLARHLPTPDHQRGRRHARASHPGAARRAHHSGPLRPARRPPVAIIGDIAHSRVARSQRPSALEVRRRDRALRPGLAAAGGTRATRARRHASPTISAMPSADADVIMMLRVQLERQHEASFPASEYFRFYGLRLEHLDLAKPDAIVMHPGPINRGRELSSEVADFAALGDSQPGGERHRRAHGGARKGDWIACRS